LDADNLKIISKELKIDKRSHSPSAVPMKKLQKGKTRIVYSCECEPCNLRDGKYISWEGGEGSMLEGGGDIEIWIGRR